MNSWVLIGQAVGSSLAIIGGFASAEAAFAYAVSTGNPGNYQICQVYGPAIAPPMGLLAPVAVTAGAWLAITGAFSPADNTMLVCYGPFGTEDEAEEWASTPGLSGTSFGFGNVDAPTLG